MHRREFLKTGAGALALRPWPGRNCGGRESAWSDAPKRAIKKGIMWARWAAKAPSGEDESHQEAGFEGTE